MELLKGVRPLDIVLTVMLAALAAFLAVENVTAPANVDVAHPLDSHSVLLIPVYLLAVIPILVRRRAIVPAVWVSTAVMSASLPMFGWVTRCGFALPLAAAFAYAVARFAPGAAQKVVGVAGVIALQVVALVMDSSTGGLEGLEVGVPLAAVLYGIGALVTALVRRRINAPTLTPERVAA